MKEYKKVTTYESEDRPGGRFVSRYSAGSNCSTVYKGKDIVWFVIGIIELLLVLRFVLMLFGARLVSITDLIYALSNPFVAPFTGIFRAVATGPGVLDISAIVAMLVYLFIGWGIAALISLVLSPLGRRC
jgi:YggT family protein